MRTHTIDNTTIEYPDQIGFCFNPVIINILGGNYQSVTATVTDHSHIRQREQSDVRWFLLL